MPRYKIRSMRFAHSGSLYLGFFIMMFAHRVGEDVEALGVRGIVIIVGVDYSGYRRYLQTAISAQ